ncbi:MAG: VWA domain-containing protein, partial [Nannocystaceae bacterium]
MRYRFLAVLFGLQVVPCACSQPAVPVSNRGPAPAQPPPPADVPDLAGAPQTSVPATKKLPPKPVQPPKRVELAHPIIDAELLYAAKVKKPKRPRRRASRTMAKKGPLKSKGVMGIGVGGIGAGGGGSGMSSPGLSAAKPSTTSGSTAVRRSLARRKPRPTKTGDPGTREEGNIRYLSADDSNSTASPVLVRQAIRAGRYVDPSLVRTYEFLNYHSFDYTPAADDKSLSIAAHMRKTTKPNEISMQVAVRSADRSPSQMQPLQATLLLDTSGSMAGPSMALARQF